MLVSPAQASVRIATLIITNVVHVLPANLEHYQEQLVYVQLATMMTIVNQNANLVTLHAISA